MKSTTKFFNLTNLKFLALFMVFLGCLFLSDEGREPLIYGSDELRYKGTDSTGFFYTPKFLFNKGSYGLNIKFEENSASTPKIELWRQSEKLEEWQVAPNAGSFSTDFTLPYDSQDVQFRIVYDCATINNQQSTINNQQSTINNQQSTINNQQSTINNQQSTINNQQSTINNCK